MIVEIIFSDYYRTFLLCILSMGVTFFIRKFSVKEGVLALVMYESTVYKGLHRVGI